MKKALLLCSVLVLLAIAGSVFGIDLQVPANTPYPHWFDTGVSLSEGQWLEISATGSWAYGGGPDAWNGPEGNGEIAYGTWLVPFVAPAYSLVGRIGEGSGFEVGIGGIFDASTYGTGRLWLAHNDQINGYSDNAGFLNVTITIGTLPPGFFSLERNLLIENIYPTHDGFFTDAYFLSGLNRALLNTQDPLRWDSPFVGIIGDDLHNRLFGSTVETESGWIDLSQGLSFTGHTEKGQWNRLGQVINPSFGFLLTEAEFGSQEWRVRQLVTDSAGIFEYHSNDPIRIEELMNVSLVYGWRCLGLAKSDTTAWLVNNFQDLTDIVSGGLEDVISDETEITTVLFLWNVGAEKINLYSIGLSYLPEDSSIKAWTSASVLFERQDGTPLGSIGPVVAGWFGADPLKNGLYDTGGQIATCEPQNFVLPVGEPIKVKLHCVTHTEAKGAAESYAGILGYELRIDGPSGTNPLIFSGTDPCPNDLDLPKGFGSSLLQAAETNAFVVGNVHVEESFGDVNSLNNTGVVILPADINSPVSGIFVPVYLVPQMRTIHAHIDAFWTDGSDLSNTCVEFMLVDDANNLRINGGLASQLFGNGEPIEPIYGLNRHSGNYDLTLDVSHLTSGNYVLAVIYGEPNTTAPHSSQIRWRTHL